ncbi:MarR family transcriptional regulator [Sporosarcina thermotolerans]|uniref:MarR family transcriptional regulator n=1 Tax=Sporosarcina thermotolerans TaxID=633404 RepID=A0AAW9AAJ4_9BACL|nr:MarR family transcriptional regulator [Sporosarcina thermotolerans]MDW0118497.1 MarR family transcriptional regulator [Sporosarcina thermotolerans]WHT47752.1 MarR family transcriptional regulator [Sporosarcina thermotolerans]
MEREEVFFELMETLYEVSRFISSYESVPRKYGTEDELYMVEVHTLNLIGDKIKTTTSEIATITNRTKGAVSQMVDKLVNKGLAVKYKNPNNNREVIIELTAKGSVVYDYHKELDKEEYEYHLSKLNQFTTDDFKNYIMISRSIIDQAKWNSGFK